MYPSKLPKLALRNQTLVLRPDKKCNVRVVSQRIKKREHNRATYLFLFVFSNPTNYLSTLHYAYHCIKVIDTIFQKNVNGVHFLFHTYASKHVLAVIDSFLLHCILSSPHEDFQYISTSVSFDIILYHGNIHL